MPTYGLRYPRAGSGGGDLSSLGIDAAPSTPNGENEEFVSGDGFSWTNQGSATATYPNHGLLLTAPASASSSLRLRTKSITNPGSAYLYRVKCHLVIPSVVSMYGGLALRESSTGKIVVVTIGREASLVYLGALRYSSPTSGATLIGSIITLSTQHGECLKDWILEVERSGSNLVYRWMPAGGGTSIQLGTEAVTASFTTQPNEWGVFANAVNGSNACNAYFPWARRYA